jgi:hypothetical protein
MIAGGALLPAGPDAGPSQRPAWRSYPPQNWVPSQFDEDSMSVDDDTDDLDESS